jgi:hypothetical protein
MIGVTASFKSHRWHRCCEDRRFSRPTASLSGARRNRRRFQGLASRAVANDRKTRRCRLCRGTARPPSLEVSRTAAQHLKKRSRRTGRSRHATVSSPNMSRVNFNGSSYANSSKSRLVTARRAALCKSQALRLPSSAISSSPVILPTQSASTGVFLPQPRHSWFYENLYLARKFHRSAPKPISFSHDRQATHSDGQTAAFAENHS